MAARKSTKKSKRMKRKLGRKASRKGSRRQRGGAAPGQKSTGPSISLAGVPAFTALQGLTTKTLTIYFLLIGLNITNICVPIPPAGFDYKQITGANGILTIPNLKQIGTPTTITSKDYNGSWAGNTNSNYQLLTNMGATFNVSVFQSAQSIKVYPSPKTVGAPLLDADNLANKLTNVSYTGLQIENITGSMFGMVPDLAGINKGVNGEALTNGPANVVFTITFA